jgi:hypothetical protein
MAVEGTGMATEGRDECSPSRMPADVRGGGRERERPTASSQICSGRRHGGLMRYAALHGARTPVLPE